MMVSLMHMTKITKLLLPAEEKASHTIDTTGGIQTRSLLKSNQGLTHSEILAPNLDYFSPWLLLWASVSHRSVSLTWIYVCLLHI